MKKLMVILVLSLFFVINVYAETCSNSELSRLKKIAEQVEFSYDYDIKRTNYEEGVLVDIDNSITALNLNPEIRVLIIEDYYKDKYQEFKYNDSKKATLKGFSNGTSVNITIEAYVNNSCSGKKLLTKKINIPYYNQFYDDERCEENRDFEYCKNEMMDTSITSRMFYDKFQKYKYGEKNEILNTDENKDVQEEHSNNLTIILILIAVIILLIISFVVWKKRKKDLL